MSLDEIIRAIRDEFTDARNTLAFAVNNPGQGPAHDRNAHDIHEAYMRSAAFRAGEKGVPPGLAYGALTGAGFANEAVAGLLEKLKGNPFYSEAGYDQGDIDANRRGLEAALAQMIKAGIFKPGAAPTPSPAPAPPPSY